MRTSSFCTMKCFFISADCAPVLGTVSYSEKVIPSEVEDAIALYPMVKDCAVVGVPSSLWGEEVFAWIVVKDGCAVTSALVDGLRWHLTPLLADHKQPSYFEFADELATTRSGKVLKMVMQNKAADLLRERSEGRERGTVPTSDLARMLRASPRSARVAQLRTLIISILMDELRLQVGDNAPLMASGMTSHGANVLRLRLNTLLAIDLPAIVAFDHPTITALALFLSHHLNPTSSSDEEQESNDHDTTDPHKLANHKLPAPKERALASHGVDSSQQALETDAARAICLESCAFRTPWSENVDSGVSGRNGRDASRALPCSRTQGRDAQQLSASATVQFGATLLDVDQFDVGQFSFSRLEAETMDPQQRLLLEVAQETPVGTTSRSPGIFDENHPETPNPECCAPSIYAAITIRVWIHRSILIIRRAPSSVVTISIRQWTLMLALRSSVYSSQNDKTSVQCRCCAHWDARVLLHLYF